MAAQAVGHACERRLINWNRVFEVCRSRELSRDHKGTLLLIARTSRSVSAYVDVHGEARQFLAWGP